jgi:hypothetical protein
MGVIAVEPRITEQIRPADPANDNSKEEVFAKAPLVWFPASSYKTAQVIADLRAEDLPLMVFANWRGFSGGMTDMFDEILKFGSMIVDNLRHFDQPVFVYLPPFATLRGGAWVVVDSQVNARVIEMYAAPTSRGGVLEAEGTAEIKFRKADLLRSMHRLDDSLLQLVADQNTTKTTLHQLRGTSEPDAKNESHSVAQLEQKLAELKRSIAAREQSLLPYYHTVATHFCDLHDTPGRMKAKKVIRDIVPWAESRAYFYWRLRRRLAEADVVRKIIAISRGPSLNTPSRSVAPGQIDEDLQWKKAMKQLSDWQAEDCKLATAQSDTKVGQADRAVVEWLIANEETITARVDSLRVQRVQELAQSDSFLQSMAQLFADLAPEQRSRVQAAVTEKLRR